MEYIGLGSNCSITYQLNKYGLRINSYPFDWVKITLQQLINVLENNFVDYIDSIQIKKISSLHPQLDENNFEMNTNSIIATNIYRIKFAHEFIDKYEFEEFKNKLQTRIDRFKNLSSIGYKIKFIRIETSVIKDTFYSNIIRLLSLLDKIVLEYELVLIINSSTNYKFPSNVKIFKYENFDSDWKMNSINWNDIFT